MTDMPMKILKACLTVAVTVFASFVAATPDVKLSRSGMCHDTTSPYYERTKNFTSYDSLQDCLAAGGALPRGRSLQEETQASSTEEYRRDYFGAGWGDLDGDCQNSRHEALIEHSTSQVVFKSGKECLVVSGRWISMFTGNVIHDASLIDIDHVVPLKWAWDHGADTWSKERRVQFANDPANLLAVEASLNRQKGAKGPSEWLPPENQCQYVSRFKRIALKYHLPTASLPECSDID